MQHILNDSDSVAAIVAERVWGGEPLKTLLANRAAMPGLRHVIALAERVPAGTIPLRDVMVTPATELPSHPADPDALAALIYTSGTTGAAKGSMHTHSTLLYPIAATRRELDALRFKPHLLAKAIVRVVTIYPSRLLNFVSFALKRPGVALLPLPAYTTAGFAAALGPLLIGDCLVLMERFIPAEALRLIQQERVTTIAAVPTLMTLMLRVPDFDRYDLSSLLYCSVGAAPVPPALVEEIEKRIGCGVAIAFGATEAAGGVVATNPVLDSRHALKETVGKLSPHWEARVVDDQRRPLQTGQVGELALRGASIMQGYYKAPELTRETIDADGWYYTGDLATIDAKGFIRIVGRKKDMIIRAGQNIYPAELEAVLAAHSQIRQVAVIGVPTQEGDERVLACVIADPETHLQAVDVLDFCRKEMAPYKVPDEVRFMTELPMNPSGKVQKYILREMVMRS
jgi:acyl-CoA synthetase (AMP-forming)/AMP-acid ligase II